MQLRSLACSLGVKISYQPPGQASKDLSKEGIVLHILEKQFINQLVSASKDQPTETTATSTPVLSVVTIHDNFHLVNVIFVGRLLKSAISVEVQQLEMSWISIW